MEKKKKNKLTLEEVQKKIEKYQKEKNEYLAGWQRARADFLNYKKDEAERIGEIVKYANENLILKILPILDNFEKAENEVVNMKHKDGKIKKSIDGFLQIKKQIQDFLKNQGVEEIKCLGEKFDPNFQEVMEEVEVKDRESGVVIKEIQKGYKLFGKVIRPAKVKIIK